MKRNSIRQMSRCPGASEFLGFMVLRGILWTKGKLKDVEVFPKELLFCFDFRLSFKELKFIKMVSCHSLSVSILTWFGSNSISWMKSLLEKGDN